jgi:hypothetical protein
VFGDVAAEKARLGRVQVARQSSAEVVLRLFIRRLIPTTQVLPDGSEQRTVVEAIDAKSVRLFERSGGTYLAVLDPARGNSVADHVFQAVLGRASVPHEALTLTKQLIDAHVASFDASRLVSAKVRDFMVYEGAVGRLEVTSHTGLQPGIAPFLQGAFHRIDSLTYEVTAGFVKGLVYYSTSGTIRVSGPLVEFAFPAFEALL